MHFSLRSSRAKVALSFCAVTVITLFLSGLVAQAAIPEPKSAGKFVNSKGTKAEESYDDQGRAGQGPYEWGKGFQVGSLILRPYVEYAGRYEDNIFFSEDDTKDDYINRLNAGVGAELPINGGQHLFTGTYREELEWFTDYSDQDHRDYTLGGALDLNFVPFSLNLEDQHQNTVDRADTEFTTRVSRQENTAHALLEIPFAQFFLETEALNFNTDYRAPENDPFDHNEFTIFQRVGLDLSPRTQVLGEYGYVNIDYDNFGDRNGDANQVMLGVRGMWGERITYQTWNGTQFRIYDNDTRPDYNGFVSRSALQYDLTETSNVVLKFVRDPQESTFDNQSFYIRNKTALDWTQQLAERIYLKTGGSASYNEYSRITVLRGQDTTRRDTVWEASVGLEYLMPNDVVSLFGGYRFRSRDSNLAGFDFDDNSIDFGARAAF